MSRVGRVVGDRRRVPFGRSATVGFVALAVGVGVGVGACGGGGAAAETTAAEHHSGRAATRAAAATAPAPGSARSPGPVLGLTAQTDRGAVAGKTVAGTDEFLGIPYAAPPVGARRWRPPAPAARWSGTRPAQTLPARCPQLQGPNGPRSTDEDCLYLSVYRPHGVRARARLPVLFWLHGGGFTTGSGGQHDGALLADTGRIEVVSINYRLGPFGFLSLPALARESGDLAGGDFGLLDQEAALRWTHRNIARFGGDPRRVALAGQSAGGISVCALLASPQARGLFSRAIVQSGSCASEPQRDARATAAAYASSVGCSAADLTCLRGKSADALLDSSRYPADLVPATGGRVLPDPPAAALADGHVAAVPVLIGTTRDEGRADSEYFAQGSVEQYRQQVSADFGPRAASTILRHYPWSAYPEPFRTGYALGAVLTDSGGGNGVGSCPTETVADQLAARGPTWVYEFDDRSAPGFNDTDPGYRFGAAHAMDLPFLWPSYDQGTPVTPRFTAGERQLSGDMVRWWAAFVRGGRPAVSRQARWPAYTGDSRSASLMSLRPGGASRLVRRSAFGAEHRCSFWNALSR